MSCSMDSNFGEEEEGDGEEDTGEETELEEYERDNEREGGEGAPEGRGAQEEGGAEISSLSGRVLVERYKAAMTSKRLSINLPEAGAQQINVAQQQQQQHQHQHQHQAGEKQRAKHHQTVGRSQRKRQKMELEAGKHESAPNGPSNQQQRQEQLQQENICAACLKPIKDRYLLMALDKKWHEDCLKCACCDCRLGEVGSSLFVHSEKILCRRDFLRIFGQHGHCAACKKSIPPYEMVMRANENAYHMDCFACQQCQYRFCVGDRFHLTQTHRIICILCQAEVASSNSMATVSVASQTGLDVNYQHEQAHKAASGSQSQANKQNGAAAISKTQPQPTQQQQQPPQQQQQQQQQQSRYL